MSVSSGFLALEVTYDYKGVLSRTEIPAKAFQVDRVSNLALLPSLLPVATDT